MAGRFSFLQSTKCPAEMYPDIALHERSVATRLAGRFRGCLLYNDLFFRAPVWLRGGSA
jgi:hypothetical protein